MNKTIDPVSLDLALPEIKERAYAEAPREAVGLLTPAGQVIPLVNEYEGLGQYFVSVPQLAYALEEAFGEVSIEVLEPLVIWHSHPGGQIGPSRGDLSQRSRPPLDQVAHLVVAFPSGIATYF